MPGRAISICTVLLALLGLAEGPAWSQAPVGATPGGGPAPMLELRTVEKTEWHIFGRVTTPLGEPVSDARVKIDLGTGLGSVKNVETNFRGEFRTSYTLDSHIYSRLSVDVSVSKPGFKDAWESVDFGSNDKTWGIHVVLRSRQDDPDQLPPETLISRLAPTFRAALSSDPDIGRVRSDAMRGAQEFLDCHDPIKAVRLL
jgi:hypothetical protein